MHHYIECLGDALPPPIAVHCVVAAADAGDLARRVLPHLLLELLQVSGAAGGQSVAPIHKSVYENAVHTTLFCYLQQSIKMILVRVHPPVREKTKNMQPPAAATGMLHRAQQHRIGEEVPILNHLINAGDVHVDDASSANIKVANFAVAHLPLGQAHVWAAGMDQSIGKIAKQAIISRLARQSDGIGLGLSTISPAIKDGEHDWFGTRGHCLSYGSTLSSFPPSLFDSSEPSIPKTPRYCRALPQCGATDCIWQRGRCGRPTRF